MTTPSTFTQIPATTLHQAQQNGAIVVTSNQRLSRFRLQQYEENQLKLGKNAWHTPQIFSWTTWIEQQWHNAKLGNCLTKQQESLLWREIINKDEATRVLNPKALSKQAMDAWNILSDFHIDPVCLQHAGEEHAALWRWGSQMNRHTAYTLQHQLLPLLTASPCTTSATIILDGFDTFTPAQLDYLQHLQASGCHIFEVFNDYPAASATLATYQDEESELRQTCQRIRSLLEENHRYSIGVLLPNLEHHATRVSRIFSEELAPGLSLQLGNEQQGEYFNISLGSVLGKQPMIQCALALLMLTIKTSVQHHEFTELLLNPYISGYGDEAAQRANWDIALGKSNLYQLTLEQFLKFGEQSGCAAPAFSGLITTIIEQQQSDAFAGRQHFSSWMIKADDLLSQFDWHNQTTTVDEQAQLQYWHDLLHQLVSLDEFCGLLRWSEALSLLQELAFDQPFRPPPGQANIQIMGLLEAANLRFDYAFVLGMDNNTWPAAAKPNPLIPYDIQVLHQTPHANSEREWLYAQAVWQHILHIAPHLEISYAKIRDKQDVQASPLLLNLKALENTDSLKSFRYGLALQQHSAPQEIIADGKIAVAATEDVRGGTGLLKAQSNCAFQAFAKYRLHLNGMQQAVPGLNAAEQGTLLHAALELFWQKIGNQSKLLELMAQEQLTAAIKAAIKGAWSHLRRFVPAQIRELEEQRLQNLMQQWLIFESQRDPFAVKQTETWRDLTIGSSQPLLLHTKIDRIDADGLGHHIILDYKTGETTAAKALGERPDEPQLAAYYLAEKALGTEADVLAIAQVRHGENAFKGFAMEGGILPAIKSYKGNKDQPADWDELTSEWREVLDRLADEFAAGQAEIAPKSSQSCTFCDFAPFCRISGSQA